MVKLADLEVEDIPDTFFEKYKTKGDELPLRKSGCGSCPATDMYFEIIQPLSKKDAETQLECAKRHFCHCTPDKSCRGVANYLKLKGKLDIKDNVICIKEDTQNDN